MSTPTIKVLIEKKVNRGLGFNDVTTDYAGQQPVLLHAQRRCTRVFTHEKT